MVQFIPALLSGIFSLGKDWMGQRKEKQQAKHELEIAKTVGAIEYAKTAQAGAQEWDNIQARNSGNSWKDEWILILVSIPLIAAFVPGGDEFVLAGFAALDKMPDWYKATVGVVVAGSYGYRKIVGLFTGGKKV